MFADQWAGSLIVENQDHGQLKGKRQKGLPLAGSE